LYELEIAVRFAFYYFLKDFEEVGGDIDGSPGEFCYLSGFIGVICGHFWLWITATCNRWWNGAVTEWEGE
jgi:hypothetical protein